MLRKWVLVPVVMVVCLLAVVGCQSLTGRSFGQHVDDKRITGQVKSKLTSESFGNLFSTSVGTHFGVVYLGGTVATPEERAEAERIASRAAGVKRVVNDIVVVPGESHRAGTSAPATTAASPATTPTR